MSKGVSKGITKESIVNTTLELIRNKENIRSVNLREIARVLGCAHTNLYNYFQDLDGIFWEAADEILIRSSDFISAGLDEIDRPEKKLEHFFKKLIDFYIENRGWFRLFWMERLQGERPDKNKKLTEAVVGNYVQILAELFEAIFAVNLTNEKVMRVFHIVHCYIHGEVSIFISGRGLIIDEREFKEYVIGESISMIRLLVSG